MGTSSCRAKTLVVENRVFTEGVAQSAIQYYENTRNFLMAVGEMKLLTFEASDLEKSKLAGGSSAKVVDCILCLKGHYEWKQDSGIGVWRYGGTVKIVSFPKGSPSSLVGNESANDSLDDSDSSQHGQLFDYLHFSTEVSLEKSNAANALALFFNRFGLALLQACLTEVNTVDDLPLNSMVIDIMLRKGVKDFSSLIASQKYLGQRTSLALNDLSKFCICGGKREGNLQRKGSFVGDGEVLEFQHRELQMLCARRGALHHMELKTFSRETKEEFQQFQAGCEEEFKRLGEMLKCYCTGYDDV
ncbi:hypothetical protein M9H77_07787 [Catharanthus roseus]|uniref:Uncharacterized protein n=1 Tax=Catharanthus roseus TaxID=4058 RepID=A0ACC0BVW5_CATRO|nr:hypothetical protein M9H77_07787 [Catharanthus roseus]